MDQVRNKKSNNSIQEQYFGADQVGGHYKNDKGKRYVEARQANIDSVGYKYNFEFFKPYVKDAESILDFGCGNGGMIKYLTTHAKHVEAIEVNPAARAMAEKTGIKIYSGVADIPNEILYDVIISNHVLEHVPNVTSILSLLTHRLRPGGKLVVKLPINDIREKHQKTWSKDDIDHHIQTWTPRLFANVLFDAGLEVQRCEVIASAWHPKLFWLEKFRLHQIAFRGFSILKNRRQLFAVGYRP